MIYYVCKYSPNHTSFWKSFVRVWDLQMILQRNNSVQVPEDSRNKTTHHIHSDTDVEVAHPVISPINNSED